MANIEVVGLESTGAGTGQLRSARPGTDTYTVTGSMSATASNATVTLSPTGTGTVAIQPAGQTTVGTAGVTTSLAGNVSATTANQTVTLSPTGTGTVAIQPAGQTTIGTSGQTTSMPGNLGLGVTPSAWSGVKAIDILGGAVGASTGSISLSQNGYYNGTNWIYKSTGYATLYEQLGGAAGTSTHTWYTAPSGTAPNQITFTNRMTLDSSGNLGVGTTPTAALHLKAGTSSASTAPLKFTSGTNLSTPEAGVVEYDGSAAYFTADTNAKRGLVPSYQFVRLASAYTTVSGSTALQQLFNTTAGGAVTVTAGAVYEFECVFGLSSLSSTSGNVGFGFGGTASFTSVWYTASCNKGNNMQGTNGTAATNTNISAASTTTSANAIVKGILVINAGGTIVPSFSVTVAAAAVVGAGSFFKLTNISNSASIGAWT